MKNIYSMEGTLFIVQLDHLNSEIMGSTFDMFYSAGALNVQCFSTITKKNRPGNVFIIDVLPEKEEFIERVIVEELNSTGWHKISTDHRHVATEIIKREVKINIKSNSFKFILEGKQVKGSPESIRPEYSNCFELKERIKSLEGVDIPLNVIYMNVQAALLRKEEEFSLIL